MQGLSSHPLPGVRSLGMRHHKAVDDLLAAELRIDLGHHEGLGPLLLFPLLRGEREKYKSVQEQFATVGLNFGPPDPSIPILRCPRSKRAGEGR